MVRARIQEAGRRAHTHFAPAPPHHTLARHAPYTQISHGWVTGAGQGARYRAFEVIQKKSPGTRMRGREQNHDEHDMAR